MNLKEFRKLIAPLWYYPWTSVFVLLCACIYAFLSTYGLMWIKTMIDGVQSLDRQLFLYGFWMSVLFVVIPSVLAFVEIVIRNRLFRKIQSVLYQKYLVIYACADQQLFEHYGTGKINSIFQRGIDNWTDMMRGIARIGVRIGFTFLSCFILLFSSFSLRIGLATLVAILVFFLISRLFISWAQPVRKQRRDHITFMDKYVVRLIMSKFEILMSGRIFFEKKQVKALFDYNISLADKEMQLASKSFIVLKSGVELVSLVVVFWLGIQVFEGSVTLGEFLLYHLLLVSVGRALFDFGDYIDQFSSQFITVEKLWSTFDVLQPLPGLTSGNLFQHQNGSIVLNNVTFAYSELNLDPVEKSSQSKKIFKTLNLEIKGGQKIALVGPSGGGKSTLIKLIAGYLFPEKGKILVDGQILPGGTVRSASKTVSLESYYQHIGYLTQEPMIFDGSIEENLLYGLHPNIQMSADLTSRMNEILRLACCEFVFDFPQGIKTEIGEKGIRLSGGQRQRLAIAKIMLKDPQIVLLDEPTSALDSLNEQLITDALHNLFVGRTVIIIAHRLQTVKECDEILVVDKGDILQRGTHNQLVKKGGYYKKMLELQSAF